MDIDTITSPLGVQIKTI